MTNLYPLQLKFANIESMLTASEGELTPEIEAALKDAEATREELLEALACLVKNTEEIAISFYRESGRLKEQAENYSARAEKFREAIRVLLPVTERFYKGTHTLSYKSSEYIEVLDETKVPKGFLNVKEVTSVDKDKAKKALKENPKSNIEGLELKTRYNLQVK